MTRFNLKLFLLGILMTILIRMDFHAQSKSDGWIPLFNGKNLEGWMPLGGHADFKVANGEIIGTTKSNIPNSFLCTETPYSDFILEFDILVHPEINSGVQFRSTTGKADQMGKGKVQGYQFEIDPSERGFSGGIYDEQRRGWLYPLSLNQNARQAFKNGVWNHCRVEAIGPSIKTWVNGMACANLVDDLSDSGFIGLQVHSIGDAKNLVGKDIKWRNIRIKTSHLDSERWDMNHEVPEMSYLVNQITPEEERKGWRLLWDGKTPAGWRSARANHFPESGWRIHEGELTILATDGGEATGPGDIVTDALFSSFELELEFKITEGANSGIKYFVDADLNKGPGSAIGCEFQILDDAKHPDAKAGVNGNRTLGSLYDLIAAEGLTSPNRPKQFKGVGVWNKARIIVKDAQVEHWLNNEKVVIYDRFSQMFRALVAYSKYKTWPGFGQWPRGSILLQDHGNTVSYRSIKIREFN